MGRTSRSLIRTASDPSWFRRYSQREMEDFTVFLSCCGVSFLCQEADLNSQGGICVIAEVMPCPPQAAHHPSSSVDWPFLYLKAEPPWRPLLQPISNPIPFTVSCMSCTYLLIVLGALIRLFWITVPSSDGIACMLMACLTQSRISDPVYFHPITPLALIRAWLGCWRILCLPAHTSV